MRLPVLQGFISLVAMIAAASEENFRPNPASKPQWVEITTPFLRTVTDLLPEPQQVRPRLGFSLNNKTDRELWLVVRVMPPPPNPSCEEVTFVGPKQSVEFKCTQDTIFANVDYPVDLVVFADEARADTVGNSMARLQFDKRTVNELAEKLALRRQELRELEPHKLPKTYEHVILKEKFGLGSMLLPNVALLGSGGLGSGGTLVVRLDGLEYTTKKRTVSIPVADIRKVSLDPLGTWVVVHYDDGGKSKKLGFTMAMEADLETLKLVRASIQALIERKEEKRAVGTPPASPSAEWPTDPLVNQPISTAEGDKRAPWIVADGAGGAIVVWGQAPPDSSTGENRFGVYARHVLASGGLDPAWPAEGLAAHAPRGAMGLTRAVADGAGGAIVTWTTERTTDARLFRVEMDVFAQHVLANGAVDLAWPTNGLKVCATTVLDGYWMVADGAGGAIITWGDRRAPTVIRAQHVLASGTVDPAWPADGLALRTASNYTITTTRLAIVADGAGGAIIVWGDGSASGRPPNFGGIHAQHVLRNGTVDPAWPAEGRALCTPGGSIRLRGNPASASDGAGGAIVAWDDAPVRFSGGVQRGNFRGHVYAQHVLASGALDPAWPADGRALAISKEYRTDPRVASDGAGGVIVIWRVDRVFGAKSPGIYAQHVLASGAVDPAWPADGRYVADVLFLEGVVQDGAGGAIVAGISNNRVLAQHVLASGVVDPTWPPDGRALCTAANGRWDPTMVADGAGGAIVAWWDGRSRRGDIYAQRVQPNGQLGGSALVRR